MARDPKVIVYGEDVELSIVGDLRGVHEQFGHARIRNTPISETTLTGMAGGLATAGGGSATAAQPPDTPYPMLMNLGGLNVAVPAASADAKGLVKTAIRSKNPCFVLEPNGRGGEFGEGP